MQKLLIAVKGSVGLGQGQGFVDRAFTGKGEGRGVKSNPEGHRDTRRVDVDVCEVRIKENKAICYRDRAIV
jgi:hypothetical protein